ncbi:hypothetical protein JKP88DRAFT_217125 [Tribonema minus]|uniref:Uncharacterized protein n=1 Tax=Tribonema minus TaxID=303371 RepID=A0A835ZGS0_9STRA|nr:hypothetical protein JKP88DRAFT_217125 [Tribonema minus]
MAFLLAGSSTRAAAVLRPAFRKANTAGKRSMSAGASVEEAEAEAEAWKKYSALFFGLVAVFSVKAASDHMAHHDHHDEDAPHYSHMRVRSKPYPWQCSDCNFIDPECYKKCKEGAE